MLNTVSRHYTVAGKNTMSYDNTVADESDTILHKHISNSYDDNNNTNTVDLLQYNDISIYIR
jgi:hypothetical protein